MIEQEPDPIKVYEFISKENKFREIEKKLPLHTILNSNKIILIIDINQNRIWHWQGSNTTPSMQTVAKKLADSIRDSYILKKFPNFDNYTVRKKFLLSKSIIWLIDEGDEPVNFEKNSSKIILLFNKILICLICYAFSFINM